MAKSKGHCGYQAHTIGNKNGSTVFETCRLQGTGKCPLDGQLPRSERISVLEGETPERHFGLVMMFVNEVIGPRRRAQCHSLKEPLS